MVIVVVGAVQSRKSVHRRLQLLPRAADVDVSLRRQVPLQRRRDKKTRSSARTARVGRNTSCESAPTWHRCRSRQKTSAGVQRRVSEETQSPDHCRFVGARAAPDPFRRSTCPVHFQRAHVFCNELASERVCQAEERATLVVLRERCAVSSTRSRLAEGEVRSEAVHLAGRA